MADTASGCFSARLEALMEALLRAAVCEITKLFEGSFSDSQMEVTQSREEVKSLKLQLEVLEHQLKEARATERTVEWMGQSSGSGLSCFSHTPDAAAGQERGAPLLKDQVLSEGEASCQEGPEQLHLVKDEVEVTELEPISFTAEGAEVGCLQIKQEVSGVDTVAKRFSCVKEGSGRGALKPKALSERASVAGPSVTRLGCVPSRPRKPRPGLSDAAPCAKQDIGDVVFSGPHYSSQTHQVISVKLSAVPEEAAESPPLPGSAGEAVLTLCAPSAGPDSAGRKKLLSNGGKAKAVELECSQQVWHRQEINSDEGGPEALVGVIPEQGKVNLLRSRYISTNSILAQQKQQLTLNAGNTLGVNLRGDRRNPFSDGRRSFAAKEKLKYHLNVHTRDRPYICPYCGKAFTYPSQQRRHLLRHSGERQYPCTLCEKSFVTPSELSVHSRVHTGEKPYSCLQCGKRFNRNGNLRAHQRSVHLRKRPFSCSVCGKTFAQKGNLRTHQQRLHQGMRQFP
ncbi:zinc finger protein 92 homolog [Megalops cyprinoides]|uniref:zinc finger protein 92 homolog n=1 Tax=Megalops cyprinoides TaxID=118141 RepID=UPI001864A532|nr:zinc finger protein 92 homolog [Megalops cyprinoides]